MTGVQSWFMTGAVAGALVAFPLGFTAGVVRSRIRHAGRNWRRSYRDFVVIGRGVLVLAAAAGVVVWAGALLVMQ